MSNIFCRSPYIIRVDDITQDGSKIELFIYASGASVPSLPTKTLSKLNSSSTVVDNFYDISPYIRENIFHLTYTPNTSTILNTLATGEYSMCLVKRYKLVGSTYTLLDSTTYRCFDGFNYQLDGNNFDNGNYLLDQSTYNYYLSGTYLTNPVGDIHAYLPSGYKIKYTNLNTGATNTTTAGSDNVYKSPRVISANFSDGNKVEFLNGSNAVQATYYFKPVDLVKYIPVVIDFINKYGVWQRESFLGASYTSLSLSSSNHKNYNLFPDSTYSQESLTTIFNVNGVESIKVNSGWVEESYIDVIKQILLSEIIKVNGRAFDCTTKQIEVQKNINNKMINYPLEFKACNNLIV